MCCLYNLIFSIVRHINISLFLYNSSVKNLMRFHSFNPSTHHPRIHAPTWPLASTLTTTPYKLLELIFKINYIHQCSENFSWWLAEAELPSGWGGGVGEGTGKQHCWIFWQNWKLCQYLYIFTVGAEGSSAPEFFNSCTLCLLFIQASRWFSSWENFSWLIYVLVYWWLIDLLWLYLSTLW
jgi:hypothetical protein